MFLRSKKPEDIVNISIIVSTFFLWRLFVLV